MSKTYFFLFGIFLFLVSCKKNENQTDAFPETNREIEITQTDEYFIHNDSLPVK